MTGLSAESGKVLANAGRALIRVPPRPLTDHHLSIDLPDALPRSGGLSRDRAEDLLQAYRRVREILAATAECDACTACLAYRWRPAGDGVGEPDYDSDHPQWHVFGRSRTGDQPPIPSLSQPRRARRAARPGCFALGESPAVPPEETDPAGCACCVPSVETDQELWRHAGVRVIRPQRPVVPRSLLVLPLRHVASPGSLTPDELVSIWDRLAECVDHLEVTGASVFVNDGRRAAQHIPHVHLHVFGRSVDEPENPFVSLARATARNRPADR
ncbi:MAG TPA: HIT domain-containing protein [Mycobacteriales bacterium]|nr:HIT domain-containing protein [Mycobacteriales bacterium]